MLSNVIKIYVCIKERENKMSCRSLTVKIFYGYCKCKFLRQAVQFDSGGPGMDFSLLAIFFFLPFYSKMIMGELTGSFLISILVKQTGKNLTTYLFKVVIERFTINSHTKH